MPKVVPEAALTEPCPWEHMGHHTSTFVFAFVGDPLATPRSTPPDPRLAGLQRLCNGCEHRLHAYFP